MICPNCRKEIPEQYRMERKCRHCACLLRGFPDLKEGFKKLFGPNSKVEYGDEPPPEQSVQLPLELPADAMREYLKEVYKAEGNDRN